MAIPPDRQVAGVHHRRVGAIIVTALNDGHQDAPLATVVGIEEAQAAAMLRAAFRPVPRRTAVHGFLLRAGRRTALVDSGCGPIKPTVGLLPANLQAAGATAEEVDTLLMTHLHPDHCGGLVDAEGRPRFPNATLRLHEAELAYWQDDAALARATDPARARAMATTAHATLAAYRGRIEPFAGGALFPGVTALHLPGHTPGHTGIMISDGADSLLIWADVVHVPELQVPRPEVGMLVDVDRSMAEATRRRIFDQVATDRLAIAGMHLHFPAFAHLARDGEGYRLVPDAWSLELRGDASA